MFPKLVWQFTETMPLPAAHLISRISCQTSWGTHLICQYSNTTSRLICSICLLASIRRLWMVPSRHCAPYKFYVIIINITWQYFILSLWNHLNLQPCNAMQVRRSNHLFYCIGTYNWSSRFVCSFPGQVLSSLTLACVLGIPQRSLVGSQTRDCHV